MAYAALVSFAQKLEQIHQDPNQLLHAEAKNQLFSALHKNVIELLAIMENFPAKSRGLEGRIADCANWAEDAIDGHVSDFLSSYNSSVSRTRDGFCENWESLHQQFQKATSETASILKEANRFQGGKDFLQVYESPRTAGVSRDQLSGKVSVVGFDTDLKILKERLYGESSHLQVIPIVGMGGSGKTTLATTLYEDITRGHFDVCAWITVSQNYDLHKALLRLLGDIKGSAPGDHEKISIESLGVRIYQELKNRRFLIVIDDIWSEKFWDHVKTWLPDDGNRSRILLTTRLEDVAAYTVGSKSFIHRVELLDLEMSWRLLKKKVFGEEEFPVELEEIGRTIAKSCGGLPLAIIVLAGLLSNLDVNQESWKNVAENVSTTITSNGEQILKILRLSYSQLPQHLKPCFLYVGIFPEDLTVRVSKLIRLWVAEGFLKPIRCKSMEETAYDYFEDLVRRNLIFVSQRSSTGRISLFYIHDLIRDLCVKTAQQEKFVYNLDDYPEFSQKGIKDPRRLSVCSDSCINDLEHLDCPSIRSILYLRCQRYVQVPLMSFRFLRVLDAFRIVFNNFPKQVCQLFHLRYLAFTHKKGSYFSIPFCINRLENLQILFINQTFNLFSSSYTKLVLPSNIWQMPQLRHLSFLEKTIVPEPSAASRLPLKNLQTLSQVVNLRFTQEVLERIPNIKKLGVFYSADETCPRWSDYYLENAAHLLHLESLSLGSEWDRWFPFWEKMKLPESLKKLSLSLTRIPWTKIAEIAGSLPNLEVLKLRQSACVGELWETREGEFSKLKMLEMDDSFPDVWRSDDSSHFPSLEQLCMYNSHRMRELPSVIGEIDTLQLIQVDKSNAYIGEWARELQEEQLGLGNELLQVRLNAWVASNKSMRRLTAFQK